MLIANPNATAAPIIVTFPKENGTSETLIFSTSLLFANLDPAESP